MFVLWIGCAEPPPAAPETPCGPGDVCRMAGVPGVPGWGADGAPAVRTWLYQPQGVTPVDGGFYVADTNNHVVRFVDADGVATVVAGSGFPDFGQGGPAVHETLHGPVGVAPDPDDPATVWIALPDHHRVGRLRDGWIDYPYGVGTEWFSGDGGPASEAEFDRPASLGFDADGAMFVADRMNQVVRRIDPDGTIDTIAGVPGVAGYAGDGGPATDALLNAPANAERDPGNRLVLAGRRLVVADTGNDVVREVDLDTGLITTLTSGFLAPHDVAFAPDGTLVVSDTGVGCVRRIHPDGAVSDVLGRCGEPGVYEPGLAPLDTPLGWPTGVAVDREGAVWVADAGNQVVLRVAPP